MKTQRKILNKIESTRRDNNKLVDLLMIQDRASGDIEYIKDMIKMFIDLMPEYFDELQGYYNDKNWTELGKQAHKMKTPVAYFGVETLRDLLSNIESQMRDNDISETELTDILQKIDALILASIGELKIELEKIS